MWPLLVLCVQPALLSWLGRRRACARSSCTTPLAAPPTRGRFDATAGPRGHPSCAEQALPSGMPPAEEPAGACPGFCTGPGASTARHRVDPSHAHANLFSFLLRGGWTVAKQRLAHPFQGAMHFRNGRKACESARLPGRPPPLPSVCITRFPLGFFAFLSGFLEEESLWAKKRASVVSPLRLPSN